VRLDRRQRLAFLPLESSLADPLLGPLSAGERMRSVRLACQDGELLEGASAGSGVLAVLGWPRLAVALQHRHRAGERVYEAVASRRRGLGRLVPNGPAPCRFP
jgi:hypothetical protein